MVERQGGGRAWKKFSLIWKFQTATTHLKFLKLKLGANHYNAAFTRTPPPARHFWPCADY